MKTIACLIVDDEPLARELLAGFCEHLPQLKLAGVCGNALDAKRFLEQNTVDLVFLDINMPVLDGISLLNTLVRPPLVIMTTAYKEYAVEAFDLEVCDYLVKPFALERFIIAVDRAMGRLDHNQSKTASDRSSDDFIFLKTEGKIYRIAFNSILFAEASGNHTRIVTTTQTLNPAMSFLTLEKLLPADLFIKVHRSFLINKAHIDRIEGNRIFIGKHEIPVGKSYRDDFFKRLRM
jgi:DNA-binding LytR/AlgR family response regulator